MAISDWRRHPEDANIYATSDVHFFGAGTRLRMHSPDLRR
jgi:hypothetical protein